MSSSGQNIHSELGYFCLDIMYRTGKDRTGSSNSERQEIMCRIRYIIAGSRGAQVKEALQNFLPKNIQC